MTWTRYSNAIDKGATEQKAVQDQFYGDGSGSLVDPFGHIWHIATHKEDVSPEEMEKRAKADDAGRKLRAVFNPRFVRTDRYDSLAGSGGGDQSWASACWVHEPELLVLDLVVAGPDPVLAMVDPGIVRMRWWLVGLFTGRHGSFSGSRLTMVTSFKRQGAG